MSDDIDALATWAEPLLRKMAPAERRKLMRRVTQHLLASNRARMKAQKNPDGTPWAPRKKNGPKPLKTAEFIYEKPGGGGELRSLRSVQRTPKMLTGCDKDRGALRSFRKDRIKRWVKFEKSGGNRRLRGKRGSIRKKAMFSKLRTAKFLKAKSTADVASLSFPGAAGEIAAVHQFGKRARVAPKGPFHDYPKRELLGVSRADLEMIIDEITQHLDL